jgi:hypothetical protein
MAERAGAVTEKLIAARKPARRNARTVAPNIFSKTEQNSTLFNLIWSPKSLKIR